MMAYLPTIISLLSGAAGGNVAGSLMKGSSLGTLGNSIAGILGGAGAAPIMAMLGLGATGDAGSSMDIANILSSVASGGVGGGGLMAIIGLVKGMMNKG